MKHLEKFNWFRKKDASKQEEPTPTSKDMSDIFDVCLEFKDAGIPYVFNYKPGYNNVYLLYINPGDVESEYVTIKDTYDTLMRVISCMKIKGCNQYEVAAHFVFQDWRYDYEFPYFIPITNYFKYDLYPKKIVTYVVPTAYKSQKMVEQVYDITDVISEMFIEFTF